MIKTDSVSTRGLRTVSEGDTALLQGFDFNNDAKTIFAPYSASIDRVTGAATIAIPSFVPITQSVALAGATHFKLVSMTAEIDFATGHTIADGQDSARLA